MIGKSRRTANTLRSLKIEIDNMPKLSPILLTLFAVGLAVPRAWAEDWPAWMGPNLDGVSTESGWSTDWPADGLPVVWAKQIGVGFSSVSIADGRLYTMGHTDGEETVWCLNAKNGNKVWTHSYPAELNDNLYEGGPGATPTVDGNRVYTLSVDGRLVAFDARSGDVQWEKNLQEELGAGLHEWGFDSSPLILENQLLVQGGRVVSFDKRDGRKLWQTPKHKAGYGSVRAFSHDGQTLLASLDCDGLRVVTAENGTERAFVPWPSPFGTNSTTPVIVDSQIYISTGYNKGCALFEFDGQQFREVYSNKRMRNHFNNSILHKGYLYGFDGNSNLGRVVTLTCMDFQTGEVQWKERGLGCGSLMIADDKLIVLSESGQLVVAPAVPDGFSEQARSRFLTGRCWTVPVLVNGRIYGRNAEGNLLCVMLPSP